MPADERELGRGRSGVVFRSRDDAGRIVARKIFGAHGLTKLVQYAFLGAPNPYVWSEPAVRCAVLRRRILAELVEFWFGPKLRVARAYGHRWNSEHRAYEMSCELIDGRHVALHHPYTTTGHNELSDIRQNVMEPLQAHLVDAGLDGLVWQAGRGNPVALNNFMCEGGDGRGGHRWVWIDLESGVPALVPANPITLLRFYVPKCVRHRRPLFDDVDVEKLRGYIDDKRAVLRPKLGLERLSRLESDIDALEQSQRKWKSLPRHRRSIGYRRAIGSISQEQADWYARHPVCWYGREIRRAVRSFPRRVFACVTTVIASIARVRFGRLIRACGKALWSQPYRVRQAREYVAARITRWQARGQLTERHAAMLREHLEAEEAGSYLSDFGVHLAVKPLVKTLEWWVVPALWMAGVVDEVFVGLFLLLAGPCVRTLYTTGRLVQNALAGRERPWVAWVVGGLPVVGNLAYPVQIVATSAHAQATAARFVLYDTMSRLGRWLPIWGGPDTLTEHLLNRCPDLLVRVGRRAAGAQTARTRTDKAENCHEKTAPRTELSGAVS